MVDPWSIPRYRFSCEVLFIPICYFCINITSTVFDMDFMSFLAKLQETANKKDLDSGCVNDSEEYNEDNFDEAVYSENDQDWPFNQFAQDFKILGCPMIETVDAADLTPLVFYRDYVARNRPVIIEGAIDEWPAMTKWTNAYLAKVAGDDEVTIDFTPDGRGDCLVMDKLFVTPFEEKMKFRDFLQLIQREKKTARRSGNEENNEANGFVDEDEESHDTFDGEDEQEDDHLAENIIPIPESLEKYVSE